VEGLRSGCAAEIVFGGAGGRVGSCVRRCGELSACVCVRDIGDGAVGE
jgi:hypothetical protein